MSEEYTTIGTIPSKHLEFPTHKLEIDLRIPTNILRCLIAGQVAAGMRSNHDLRHYEDEIVAMQSVRVADRIISETGIK